MRGEKVVDNYATGANQTQRRFNSLWVLLYVKGRVSKMPS